MFKQLLQEAKFYNDYSRWNEETNSYETWEDSVERVMNMHRTHLKNKLTKNKYEKITPILEEIEDSYKKKEFAGSQRALQFGGEPILRKNSRMYNCLFAYLDKPVRFGEYFWFSLSGCGCGISLQKHHIEKLPKFNKEKNKSLDIVIEDSIEGWADAFKHVVMSYLENNDYSNTEINFNYDKIREKGAYISGGFKAPGPKPLKDCIEKCKKLLNNYEGEKLDSITIYDLLMYAADATLAGGVRRSSTIILFSKDDQNLIEAKSSNYYIENPQRSRSNNSAMCLRNEITLEELSEMLEVTRANYGDPGIYFTDSLEFGANPCVEIGFYPVHFENEKDKENSEKDTGWQACNLCEINGSKIETEEDFYRIARLASYIGTIQATYTDFEYCEPVTQKIIEREALIGVSLTGWTLNPEILLNTKIMNNAAKIVVKANKEMAKLLGINPSPRCTTVKPSGNVSTVFGTPAGVKPEHSRRYIRHMQINDSNKAYEVFSKTNTEMMKKLAPMNGNGYALAFPIEVKENAIFEESLLGTNMLKMIEKIQRNWVLKGVNKRVAVDSRVNNNVSNTVTIDEKEGWEKPIEYFYKKRKYFTACAFNSSFGDLAFVQTPYSEVKLKDELVKIYDKDKFEEFYSFVENNYDNHDIPELFFHNYALENKYKEEDFALLKYCYRLYYWNKIHETCDGDIKFGDYLSSKKDLEDINTLGAIACSGGVCSI